MAVSNLKFISGIPGQSEEYIMPVFQSQIGRVQTQVPAFDEFIWAFWDRRHKDCLTTAQDMFFGHQLPDTTGTSPLKTREYIKQMIVIMECDTPILKERWLGHPSIPPRMFRPRQYLVTPPMQWTKLTKPKVTLKPLPPTLALKLVPKKTQSNLEYCRRVKLTGGSDARGSGKAEVGPINCFIC